MVILGEIFQSKNVSYTGKYCKLSTHIMQNINTLLTGVL